MNDDTRGMIYGTLVVFLIFLVSWLGFVYLSACGFTLNCIQGAPLVVRTPVPTLIPYGEVEQQTGMSEGEFNQCEVAATELIGAWVAAGHTESDPFPFTDVNGQDCEATFGDVQPLFVENSIWFPGSLGCISCHNADLTDRSGGLDLTSFESISLGSRRVAESTSPGTDIFGNGEWESSLLHEFLVNHGLTAQGHSPDVEPPQTIIYAGQLVAGEGEGTATPEATATP
ncbi:MAG TPA: hypothetical protein VK897_01685 [Anaerolineales bacterium]|nr:hypothetical protein [Anaerolineales bacterium]